MDALWFGLMPSRRRVEEVCGVLSYQEIRLVVGSPGRATGDITFVEDAGVEREGCLACFLGHLVQRSKRWACLAARRIGLWPPYRLTDSEAAQRALL